jgi:hypothetical protein
MQQEDTSEGAEDFGLDRHDNDVTFSDDEYDADFYSSSNNERFHYF